MAEFWEKDNEGGFPWPRNIPNRCTDSVRCSTLENELRAVSSHLGEEMHQKYGASKIILRKASTETRPHFQQLSLRAPLHTNRPHLHGWVESQFLFLISSGSMFLAEEAATGGAEAQHVRPCSSADARDSASVE